MLKEEAFQKNQSREAKFTASSLPEDIWATLAWLLVTSGHRI